MSEILTARGQFFVGNLDPFDPNNLSPNTTVANAMRSLGIVSKFTLEPAVDRVKVPEWSSGADAIAESWTRVTGGKVKLLADESNPDNLALNLAGRVRTVGPESVTGAKIAVKNAVTGKYAELTGTTALKATTGYYFVRSISDDGLSYEPYNLIDTTTFVLNDSSTTPKTLTLGTDYSIDGITGKLVLKGTTGHGVDLPGLTYPLSAAFNMGLFVDTLPQPIAAGKPYMLSQKNISHVSLRDSSATPKLIPDSYYTIDSDYGMLTITDRASIMAISGLTLPLKVLGTQGEVKVIGLMSEGALEKQVRMNGINQRTRQKIVVTLYKVSFDSSAVDFFDKDYAKTPLEGELLADPSKPVDDMLGQFGKIEYL